MKRSSGNSSIFRLATNWIKKLLTKKGKSMSVRRSMSWWGGRKSSLLTVLSFMCLLDSHMEMSSVQVRSCAEKRDIM